MIAHFFLFIKQVLERESSVLIDWFENNFMKANPDKFQAIGKGEKAYGSINSFTINDVTFTCEDNVALLGINIDLC